MQLFSMPNMIDGSWFTNKIGSFHQTDLLNNQQDTEVDIDISYTMSSILGNLYIRLKLIAFLTVWWESLRLCIKSII